MPRTSFIYLYEMQRRNFVTEIDKTKDIYFDRLKKALSADPEKEAGQYCDGRWEQLLRRTCSGDCSDPSNLAEHVEYESFLYYDLLQKSNYRILAMWICCLYETWEQQVLYFIRQEIENGDLREEKVPQKYDGIERLWKKYGMNIKEWNCWTKLNECRLVTNTIKHGEGQSERELREMRPDLFEFQNSICGRKFDRLRLYHSTINEITLNITERDLENYADALMEFWELIPTNQHILRVEK